MWLKSKDNLILKENEVHIWRANLDLDKSFRNTFLKCLSSDEKKRANKFRFKKDRQRFIAGRGILRTLIGKYLGAKPATISFQYSEYGKPSLLKNPFLQFNISHSKNIGVFAFTKEFKIGIDVEYVNLEIETKEIAKRFFSKNEVKSLFSLPEKQLVLGFFNCWTRKEAFIKAVGEGLSFPLDSFEVSLKPNQPAKLLATNWNPDDITKWSVYTILNEPNFIGSLVVKGKSEKVKMFEFNNDFVFNETKLLTS